MLLPPLHAEGIIPLPPGRVGEGLCRQLASALQSLNLLLPFVEQSCFLPLDGPQLPGNAPSAPGAGPPAIPVPAHPSAKDGRVPGSRVVSTSGGASLPVTHLPS
jgi:hypothetical protein